MDAGARGTAAAVFGAPKKVTGRFEEQPNGFDS
jgi:hypothetical protein